MQTFWGILIPFLGTALGAACVFFMKKALSDAVQRSLTGFAAGVMVAASVWSLLIPAIEAATAAGGVGWLPAAGGFLLLLSQLGLQLRSEKTRLDNLHAFRGGRNKLYLGCGRRGCRYQTASQFGRFRRRRGSCLIGHRDKMAGKLE